MVKFSLHLIIQRDWTLVNPPIGALFSLREHGMPCLVVFADHSATVIPLTPSSVYPCSYFAWHSHRDMMHFLGDFFSLLWASDCSPVSTTPTSSLSSCKFQEGFEVCMASSLSSAPSSMPSTTSTTAASPTETSSTLDFLSLSSLDLLDEPKNILHLSNDPDVTSSLLALAFPTLDLPLFKERNFSILPTNNSPYLRLFWLRRPRSHQEHRPPGTGPPVWLLPHAYTSSLLSLRTAIITYILLCGYPSFCANTTPTIA